MKKYLGLLIVLSLWTSPDILSQRRGGAGASSSTTYDEKLYNALEWRSIGPFRGGRSAAVTGVPGKTNLFYFGSTGGGVWRTRDGGQSWEIISDGYFGGSIGVIAVSDWDNNVMYVGGGEKTVRGNVSYGSGMWKSLDAGKTWKSLGLKESRHIARIRIHPKNPDLVYAAIMGDLFKSSEMRGVYRSKDGGNTWERILFANADAGAVDLIMDPNNPRILYASTWRIRRTPYSLESGGDGSAIWKSTDGGDTWKNIISNQGLPKGAWGISGITVSPVNSSRVYAIIENENGGVFRSNDGGETWTKTNDDRNLRQRAWYYTRIYADTKEEDKVYVLNVRYHVSKDGGRTFETNNAPHGDHHDLWIAPEDNQRMVIADDGGAQVSFDGGENWSTYHNQPTAQFYRVTTDNHFPYRIYGAQQDNSTVRIMHRNVDGGSIGEDEWESTAGGESGFLAVDPEDNDIVYGGSYGGLLTRVNHRTGEARGINVWPDNPMGHGAEDSKYRFQWNFPIFFSPHDPNKLYCTSNVLHVTTNEGQSWTNLSGDLTRADPKTLGPSGGPITRDNTSVEYYATIFAAIESPYEKDLLWTGSDDGLVHISKDGGKNWTKVTPAGMPEWMMINSIDADPFVKGGAYIAGTRYKLGDYRPYLYKTKDYGASWTLITAGIDPGHFTRVVRADPKRQGLLYAGTEEGMYISFDDGASWKSFQMNLPIVPITDLTVKNDNLVAATQGRSFWLIDDLTPLHQLTNAVAASNFHLYKPMPSYRVGGRGFNFGGSRAVGQNHPGGVMLHYYLKNKPDTATSVSMEIMEMDGTLIQKFSSQSRQRGERLEVEAGMNRLVWDMRYPAAERFDGMIVWSASMNGPVALPGTYKAKLTVNEQSIETEFEIVKDPRSSVTAADLKAQFDFLISVRDKLTETHTSITDLRKVRGDINTTMKNVQDKEIKQKAKTILNEMKIIEEELYQTKNRSGQDPLNYPIRLNNKLGHLNSIMSIGNNPPTQQAIQFQKEVTALIDEQLKKLEVIFTTDIPELNNMLKEAGIDFIKTEKKSQDTKTQ
jgi:photosystem II stability/assembly factor-like uncharacterized protein